MSFSIESETYCAIHNEMETIDSDSIICPECCHAFADKQDVVATELQEWSSLWEHETPTFIDILSCPLCTHDW